MDQELKDQKSMDNEGMDNMGKRKRGKKKKRNRIKTLFSFKKYFTNIYISFQYSQTLPPLLRLRRREQKHEQDLIWRTLYNHLQIYRLFLRDYN